MQPLAQELTHASSMKAEAQEQYQQLRMELEAASADMIDHLNDDAWFNQLRSQYIPKRKHQDEMEEAACISVQQVKALIV